MSYAYTKLFQSILSSSIWGEAATTRLVWITMLAMADQNGEVHAAIPGLARLAGVSIPDVEAALEVLMSPDPYSRTPDGDGRRAERIDGGWVLLNHALYRRMGSDEHKRALARDRQRRHRERERDRCVTGGNPPVTEASLSRQEEAEADTEANTQANAEPKPAAAANQAPCTSIGSCSPPSQPDADAAGGFSRGGVE